jgi:hypothetical protein
MKLENELHTTEHFDLIEKKKSDLNILIQKKKRENIHHILYQSRNKYFLQIKLFLNLLMNLEM